ncbi:MAG: TolC family protein [Paucibacter sp.]|nr:TolC family protein [Roseateles sp.]
MRPPRFSAGLLLAAAAALSGCASLDPEAAYAPLRELALQQSGQSLQLTRAAADQARVDAQVEALLAAPLTMDAAVQLALLNNRALQASLQELGLGEAERAQAGRLANPGFSIARLRRGDERERELGLGLNLGQLLALPQVREIEARRLRALQQRTGLALLALAADTRRAWVSAVAAEQTLRYQRDVLEAAEAGAELGRRMVGAGNWNRLQLAREQGFAAEAALALARAEQQRLQQRERLARLLGLWGEPLARLRLPTQLPDLPPGLPERAGLEQQALAQRLDVQAARAQTEATARSLGLSRISHFINALELGVMRNSSNEAPLQTGAELRFEIPLFDWGEARQAHAEALYLQSVHQAAHTAIQARSEVREAELLWRSSYDIARHHRDELLPIARRISEENLLRYNGMFISVFELLADTRAQIAAVNAALAAQRDFWLAQAALDQALLGPSSAVAVIESAATTGPAPAATAAH